ncbi:MAG TPA: twin-arginine translocase subunit TatB [Rhodobacteraceae bacterium]|nr:twin-arginine translocase subunit TatB [Paracoccaceae bacterium]
MFDIGWTELLVIGVVALIVVGPKDLPGMFRTLGRFTGKAKAMARDFQSAMNDAADQTGVKDVADDLKNMTSKKNLGLDALDDVASKFEDWNPAESVLDKKTRLEKEAKKAKKSASVKERTAAADKMRKATAKKAGTKTPAAKKPAASKTAEKPAAKKPATAKTAAAKPARAKPATKPKTKPASKAKPKTAAKPKTRKPKTGSKS